MKTQITSLECTIGFVVVSDQSTFAHILYINTLMPRQNDRHFPDEIFKCILANENV